MSCSLNAEMGLMRARWNNFLLVTVILLLLLNSFACFAQDEKNDKEDSFWAETSQALETGNASEALRLLRLCVLGQINLPESEKLLRLSLASEAALILSDKPLVELKPDQLSELFRLQREVCNLGVAEAGDWLNLLRTGAVMPGSENLIISGQAFLDVVQQGLPVNVNDEWREFLQRLDREMVRDEQILYRRQIVQILANLEPESRELQNRLADIELLAEAKAVKVLGLAEVEIALGNLVSARGYLDQVRNYNSQYLGLAELYQRLEKAERIDKILIQANDALLSKKYDEAKRRAQDILIIDANNFFARRILKQVEEAQERPAVGPGSPADRLKLKLRRFEADLRKAEKEEDLQLVLTLLREILVLKSDLPEYSQRLADVEQEIALSRLKADERFIEAEELFEKAEYARLRLFLNRNPGLMNSVEKMLKIWEMRLMANQATGHLDASQLREAAETINKKAGKSFYASYVLMRLSISDNKLAEAREHYKVALELKPGEASLRWPGLLLWVHGEGRPVAVFLLIVVFLLMIKLIRPFFEWFESTYWWRVSLLARPFPSLAIRSLEGCFGTVSDRAERITLFTLLMKSCYRVGNSSKALLYSDNLLDIVPGHAAALEIRAKIKAKPAPSAKPAASQSADAPKLEVTPEPEFEAETLPQYEERRVIASGLQRDVTSEVVPEVVSEADGCSESFAVEDFLDNAQEEYDEGVEDSYIASMSEDAAADDKCCDVQHDSETDCNDYAEVNESDLVAGQDFQDCPEHGALADADVKNVSEAAADMGEDLPVSRVELPAEQHDADSVVSEDEDDEKAAKDAIGDAAADLFKDFFPEQETQSLRNQSAESKIEQKRHELFAELDSIQKPQPASDAWLEHCNLNTTSDRWFKELD
ncbi:MAG: hypothetical protein KKB51_17970 [Candidatus Riflebacteria bacterium]|nr:hypothetical protein [Candidatus Riflebacteria bacterium]